MPSPDNVQPSDSLAGNAHTTTISITVAANSNRWLYFALLTDNSIDLEPELSVLDNGVPMSFRTKSIVSTQSIFVFRIAAPAAGAHSVVANWTTDCGFVAFAISLYDLDQIEPESTTPVSAGNAGSANPSFGITSAVGQMVLAIVSVNNDDGVTTDPAQTEIGRVDQGSVNAITCGIVTTKPGASGTVTNSWTAASQRWGGLAMSFRAPVIAASSSPRRAFNMNLIAL